jgi:phage baseplate assembly protein gpV
MAHLLYGTRARAGNAPLDGNPPLRVGIVHAQDAASARVRVVFPDYDQMLSYWLPVLFAKTQNDKEYWIPDIGEQVVCLMDLRDEAGVVLGAIYSSVDLTPVDSADKWRLQFRDSTSFEYDRALHVLDLHFQDSTDFKYDANKHLLALGFQDSSEFQYDAGAHQLDLHFNDGTDIDYNASSHALQVDVVAGGTVTIAANGARIAIDSSGNIQLSSPGNVQVTASGQIQLGALGQLRGVARLGDQVQCPAGIGQIVSASINVEAD